MSKNKKIFLGILTFLPIAYILFFIVTWFGSFFFAISGKGGDAIPIMFPIIFALHALAMLLIMGLWLYYIIHCARSTAFDSNQKLMWILVIAFGSILGMIAYYYVNIWKDPAPKGDGKPLF